MFRRALRVREFTSSQVHKFTSSKFKVQSREFGGSVSVVSASERSSKLGTGELMTLNFELLNYPQFSAVAGLITVDTSLIELAGNPPFFACSFTSSMFSA